MEAVIGRSGEGQTTGHIADAIDSRMRLPARKRWAVDRRATRTSVGAPGSSAAGDSWEVGAARGGDSR